MGGCLWIWIADFLQTMSLVRIEAHVMRFITDRKRALGMGSAKSGTEHFWEMKVSSVALLILIPLFIFTFGSVVGNRMMWLLPTSSNPFLPSSRV